MKGADERASQVQGLAVPHPDGLSVLVSPEKPALDIVFIHGFTGDPRDTWACKNESQKGDDAFGEPPHKFFRTFQSSSSSSCNERIGIRNGTYWPRDLVPNIVPDARVLTYGYDTHIRHMLGRPVNQSTVYDIARDFLVDLEAKRRSEASRPLVFIAHSLGGIVVKETLRQSHGFIGEQSHLHSVYEHTFGIIFFGTPHGGADPRNFFHRVAVKAIETVGFLVSEQVMNSLLPTSQLLKQLRDEFSPIARRRRWVIHSFQEQYGVKYLNDKKVVEDTASCLNDRNIEVTQHIARNHMEMCRFNGANDVEFEKVANALNRIIAAIPKSGPPIVTPITTCVLNDDERQRYLDSLKFDQIDARHATIKNAHAKTCKWLLLTSEYQDWLDVSKLSEHHGFLWIKGKPATGKSTIMKFALTQTKKRTTGSIIISFFFNARGEELEKSIFGMYRSLLFQLLQKVSELQSLFDTFAPTGSDGYYTWNIETLKELLYHAVEKLSGCSLICFIDALDECDEDQVREMVAFLEHLGRVAVSRCHLHVCFSSRHYPHITFDKGIELVLEGQGGHDQDIADYLHSELKAKPSKLINEIKENIFQRASGIFLWVVLVVAILNKEIDHGRIHVLRKRLDEIPSGLDELFENILTRDGQNMDELILCLQWILYAKRPLKREELYFAILSGCDPAALSEWDREEVPEDYMVRFILSSSKGLVEMTKSKNQVVQFIHESVADYLRGGKGLHRLRSDLSDNFPGNGHAQLKQCCQNYMAIDIWRYLPFDAESLPAANSNEAATLRQLTSQWFPFLQYAIQNVLYHADKAEDYGITQETFVQNFPLENWIKLNNLIERYQIRRYTAHTSLLYILAEHNLPNLIRVERKRLPHINISGERYGFPLNSAIAHLNEEAIRALLLPSNNRFPNGYSSAVSDFEEAIETILKNQRNITSRKDRNTFSWAVEEGHEAVVKLLLAVEGIDANAKDQYGRTPLHCAARNGHQTVIKLLLAVEGIDANAKDQDGQTPLHRAAINGHETVVKLLLAVEGIDANAKDQDGQTPLHRAAMNGHETVVKLLLAVEGIDANAKDQYGRTPLTWAAMNGHETVVKLLLAVESVDANAKDQDGQTPLYGAAINGHETVVKLLLAVEGIDANAKDQYGRTPLYWAAINGHETVVKLLLAVEGIDANAKDQYGQTPLHRAAMNGHETVVKLLLAVEGIDANVQDQYGQTPLHRAAMNEHEAVVKLLAAATKELKKYLYM